MTDYALIDTNGNEVAIYRGGLPKHAGYGTADGLVLRFSGGKPGDVFVGMDGAEYTLVERREVARPTEFHLPGTEQRTVSSKLLTVSPGWTFSIEQARARLTAAVKREAYERIVAFVPEWKQRNLTAQAVLLIEKGRANWTAEEAAAWAAGKAIWDAVAAIRAHSDALEAEIAALTDQAGVSAWRSDGWPAPPKDSRPR